MPRVKLVNGNGKFGMPYSNKGKSIVPNWIMIINLKIFTNKNNNNGNSNNSRRKSKNGIIWRSSQRPRWWPQRPQRHLRRRRRIRRRIRRSSKCGTTTMHGWRSVVYRNRRLIFWRADAGRPEGMSIVPQVFVEQFEMPTTFSPRRRKTWSPRTWSIVDRTIRRMVVKFPRWRPARMRPRNSVNGEPKSKRLSPSLRHTLCRRTKRRTTRRRRTSIIILIMIQAAIMIRLLLLRLLRKRRRMITMMMMMIVSILWTRRITRMRMRTKLMRRSMLIMMLKRTKLMRMRTMPRRWWKRLLITQRLRLLLFRRWRRRLRRPTAGIRSGSTIVYYPWMPLIF